MDLAGFIELERDRNSLSFRDLEKAGELDHAYIWHLAKGTKTAPSLETLEKLSAALRLDDREREVLHLLSEQPVDDALFSLMLNRRDLSWDDLRDASRVSNRGDRQKTEDGWLRLIELMQQPF